MPRIRIAAAVAGALLLGATTPAVAGTASYDGHAQARFAGVTTFTAAHSGRAMLRLTRTVTVDTDRFGMKVKGLTIHGDGRIVGVAVTAANGRAGFVELRMRSCFTAACPRSTFGDKDDYLAVTWGGPMPTGTKGPAPFRLSPGLYQVSVYADGAPLAVSWQMPGLRGRTHVAVKLPQRGAVQSPPEHGVAGSPATPLSVQSSGDYTLATDVVVFGIMHRVRGGAHVDSESSWCIYQGSGPPNGVMTAGCPGGDGVGFGATYVTTATDSGLYGVGLTVGPGVAGHYVQGSDETGVQVATDVHDSFFWADAGMVTQSR